MIPLFDTLEEPATVSTPVPMEALNQSYGFILYEHILASIISGILKPGNRPRDRVQVYINGISQGIIDSQYQHPRNVSITLHPNDKLQLLVENLGRVDYFSRERTFANYLREPNKGIVGDVSIGGTALEGWDIYTIPLENLPSRSLPTSNDVQTPLFYHGNFSTSKETSNPAELDTYLAIPNGVKGQVFVNGFNLGRYWLVGPQQSLYLPGTLLEQRGENEVIVLELEPHLVKGGVGEMTAVGLEERDWYNRADPDCYGCV